MAENGVPMLGSPHIHLIPGGSVMRAWLAILFLISSPVFAGDSSGLVGNWKLVSSQVIVENEPPRDLFGPNPNGYLILTREGRSMVLTTAGHRKGGTGDPERAALHKSMLAYTGKYRIEGSDFITVVDASWNEDWNGTEQRRHFRIEGDRLFIDSAPAPSIVFPGKTDFRRLVWEREK
jgi:hypothetical protein